MVVTAAVLLWFSGLTQAASSTILVLGDSLSAGYGLPAGQGWVDLLARRLARDAPDWQVVNASISGETTLGGLNRLPPLLARHKPEVVIVELGANDGLRGMDLGEARANLERIVAAGKAIGARHVILGMRIPPNYGPKYTERFFSMFGDVAKAGGAAYVPFLFDGFAEDRGMFQDDGIHPLPAAQPRMLDTVWKALAPLLSPAASSRPRRAP